MNQVPHTISVKGCLGQLSKHKHTESRLTQSIIQSKTETTVSVCLPFRHNLYTE